MKRHWPSTLFVLMLCAPSIAGDLTPPGPPASTPTDLETINVNALNARANASSAANRALQAIEAAEAAQDSRAPISTLPSVIDEPGSYFLTENLSSAGAGITVATSEVSIDLNGFALVGQPGSGDGIEVTVSGVGLRVHGGTLRGWGGDGIDAALGDSAQISGVVIYACGGTGLRVRNSALISDCSILFCGGDGIVGQRACLVQRSNIRNHVGRGVVLEIEATVEGCRVSGSEGGIVAQRRASISDCTVRGTSTAPAISLEFRSIVTGCIASGGSPEVIGVGNDSIVRECVVTAFESLAGIRAGSASVVRDCTVSSTSHGFGISAGSASLITGCVSRNNGTGNPGDTVGGIFARGASIVENCSANFNEGPGIQVNNGVVNRCNLNVNRVGILAGSFAQITNSRVGGSQREGIIMASFGVAENNSLFGNGTAGTFAGLQIGSENAVHGNILTRNDIGIETTGFFNIITGNRAGGAGQDSYGQVTGTQREGAVSTDPAVAGPFDNLEF